MFVQWVMRDPQVRKPASDYVHKLGAPRVCGCCLCLDLYVFFLWHGRSQAQFVLPLLLLRVLWRTLLSQYQILFQTLCQILCQGLWPKHCAVRKK